MKAEQKYDETTAQGQTTKIETLLPKQVFTKNYV
jgi:hypothetical protein